MPADIVGQPSQCDRLRDVPTTHNEKQGKVAHANGDVLLQQQENVADASNSDPGHAKAIAMPYSVSRVGSDKTEYGCHDEDGNTPCLCLLSLVAQLLNNGRNEELKKGERSRQKTPLRPRKEEQI